MTDRIAEIRARHKACRCDPISGDPNRVSPDGNSYGEQVQQMWADREFLLSEIDRLTAEVERLGKYHTVCSDPECEICMAMDLNRQQSDRGYP